MRANRFAPLAVALVAAACIDGLSPASERTGFISASTVQTGPGPDYGLTFVGAFYRFDGLEVGLEEPDVCQAYIYSPLPPPTGTFPTIDAGERLVTLISGNQDTLVQTNPTGVMSYQLPSIIGSVAFTPGDTLTVDIPGSLAGFPAATLRVRTAEPFTFDAVGTAGELEPLQVTWTAAPAPGSLMLYFLRYSSISTTDVPNTEIRCSFIDDGSGTVPVPFSSSWSGSPVDSRSVVTQRVRTTELVIDPKTKVTLLSFFDRPLPPGAP